MGYNRWLTTNGLQLIVYRGFQHPLVNMKFMRNVTNFFQKQHGTARLLRATTGTAKIRRATTWYLKTSTCHNTVPQDSDVQWHGTQDSDVARPQDSARLLTKTRRDLADHQRGPTRPQWLDQRDPDAWTSLTPPARWWRHMCYLRTKCKSIFTVCQKVS